MKHKEAFKTMRAMVDVLSMSATPIPRTLYLALTSARDMSVIDTPPVNRHPIQTIVKTYDEKIVVDAIRHEMRRGGQVFYLHNRVGTIDLVAGRLRALMPDLSFGVGHGQMGAHALERVMTEFVAGRYNVLVCTTIIESGLDIPNCNTLIIEGADRFGLSQLYQLRGRVGRFKHQAYAYLLLHRHTRLLDAARQRMNTLRQHTQLGAGFKIAMRDLELQGRGQPSGGRAERAHRGGRIRALLPAPAPVRGPAEGGEDGGGHPGKREARFRVCGRRGPGREPRKGAGTRTATPRSRMPRTRRQEAEISRIQARIPVAYIGETRLRIDIYRRLAMADSIEAVRQIEEELRDRFGKPFPEVRTLLQITEIRVLAEQKGILSVESESNRLKCLRGTGQRDDWVMIGTRFPRLTAPRPHLRLKEIIAFLKHLPNP